MSLSSNSEVLSLPGSLPSSSSNLTAVAKVTDAGGYRNDEDSPLDRYVVNIL